MHNAIFDCAMVANNYKINIIEYLHTDTMILGHLLDENRSNGLKELATSIFGEESKAEQVAMKASVTANGGQLTKDHYELYKADADLLGNYGAKDAILTIKLFYVFMDQLYEQKLDDFFFTESMPLLKGPTYDLNTVGLKVDMQQLEKVKGQLEAECLEAQAFIYAETDNLTKDKYKKFNPNSSEQLAWLLYAKLGNDFNTLTDAGREICKFLGLKLPYNAKARREFLKECIENKGRIYKDEEFNPKTKKIVKAKKIADPWKYTSTDAKSLKLLADKYKWVEKLLELNKNKKLLSTYVIGIQERVRYGIIHPSFLQHGTTSGRYSSRNPNFQNLPRKDKRIKSCIIARPGKMFVGADYAQLEPRVFASLSGDENLMNCFKEGKDFYSVVGAPVFDKTHLSLIKDQENSFATKFPNLRDKAKVIALATPYGRTASFTASEMGVRRDEAQDMMDKYFQAYPKVELMMLTSHEIAKADGVVYNLYGRPRRIPEAKNITKIYGHTAHSELPYEARTLLNLAMNHRIQSTGASIVNRACIRLSHLIKEAKLEGCYIVMQVHDEVILECKTEDAEFVSILLKECMEKTVTLPGVDLVAEPKVSSNLADLK